MLVTGLGDSQHRESGKDWDTVAACVAQPSPRLHTLSYSTDLDVVVVEAEPQMWQGFSVLLLGYLEVRIACDDYNNPRNMKVHERMRVR